MNAPEAAIEPPEGDDCPKYAVDKVLIRKAVVGLIVILAVAGTTGVLFREPLQALGDAFIGRWGLGGLAIGVIITDASPLPLTNEPLVFLARGAGLDLWTIFGVVSGASVAAGSVGYWSGRVFGGALKLAPWMAHRHPGLTHYMTQYGAEGVAIAALLPIPFALSTWSAGILRVPYGRVFVATLVRIPKTIFYALIIVGGLAAGGA